MMSKRVLSLVAVGSAIAAMSAWAGCVGDSTTPQDSGGPDTTTDTQQQDTSTNDTGTKDAAVDVVDSSSPQCTPSKAFGPITLMPTFGGPDGGVSGARLSNDSLTVYFSNANGNAEGFVTTATRASLASPFNTPTVVQQAGTDAGLWGLDPSISPDALTIYLQYNPGGYVEVRYATRLEAGAPFSTPTGVTGLSGAPPNHGAPFLQGDNSALYYGARLQPDGGQTLGPGTLDIFYGAITGQGQFSNVVPRNELNTIFDETSPAITADGLTVYFARKEATDGGMSGTFHVYRATRGSIADAFNTPSLVTELDDAPTTNTSPTWISPDDCTIWIASDRGGPAGAIYTATRPL